ncbi:unnamed protein product [Schistosoma mattheei]|uniref:F-actin-capping protein subunit beta n=1 Tax=Schistosoma mattheei TaxID=31246 RepID=A0A183NMY7_9TREM|nr:unnamed protein product [Schistosoma mattheei]
MDHGFAGVILIKKAGNAKLASGCWDSIHVIDVVERPSAKISLYKLTSTVMLWLQTQRESAGYFNLGGSLSRFSERVPITTSSFFRSPEKSNWINSFRIKYFPYRQPLGYQLFAVKVC